MLAPNPSHPLRHNQSDVAQIPRQFHFVFGLRDRPEPLHLVHYLCLASCLRVNRPDRIFFYCGHEPTGRYWRLIEPHVTILENVV